MKFYVQLDQDNCVHDCITYPHAGYTPVELNMPLPDGFLGGWYRLIDGQPVFDRELYEQINELPRLRDERNAAIAATAEMEQTLDQVIQDARAGLTSVPTPGEAWADNRNYTTGDTATDGGTLYIALRYSKGKRPSESPEHWAVKPVTPTYPTWASITDGTVIIEGTIVEHDGALWVCTGQHIKSTVYKPKDGSSKWERYE